MLDTILFYVGYSIHTQSPISFIPVNVHCVHDQKWKVCTSLKSSPAFLRSELKKRCLNSLTKKLICILCFHLCLYFILTKSVPTLRE